MKKTKGYKAFNKGMKCRDFQYEVGKTYEHKGDIELCSNGFHFCTNPLDVLNYYDLTSSEFAEVETSSKMKSADDDSKVVTDKLTVVSKLDLTAFIDASISFLFEYTKLGKKKDTKTVASGYNSKLAASGDESKLAASGNYSKLAASGYNSKLAASGDESKLAASGNYSQLAASGDESKLAASGDESKLAASGNYSKLAASGDESKLAASGNYSKLAASGYNSKLAVDGENSIAAGIGYYNKVKGKKGNWIVLAEYDAEHKVICVKSAQIDGKKIKEDTWYELKNGKFVVWK